MKHLLLITLMAIAVGGCKEITCDCSSEADNARYWEKSRWAKHYNDSIGAKRTGIMLQYILRQETAEQTIEELNNLIDKCWEPFRTTKKY